LPAPSPDTPEVESDAVFIHAPGFDLWLRMRLLDLFHMLWQLLFKGFLLISIGLRERLMNGHSQIHSEERQ
jgi:hypothetical protein